MAKIELPKVLNTVLRVLYPGTNDISYIFGTEVWINTMNRRQPFHNFEFAASKGWRREVTNRIVYNVSTKLYIVKVAQLFAER